eukprot:GHVO01070989.1.p1 GENE.GHVO01070989.1~~GHVO01070989.1.p1  ORF type:complete len:159 (-),score=6.97 GHVO01070989.1:625-1101(-)
MKHKARCSRVDGIQADMTKKRGSRATNVYIRGLELNCLDKLNTISRFSSIKQNNNSINCGIISRYERGVSGCIQCNSMTSLSQRILDHASKPRLQSRRCFVTSDVFVIYCSLFVLLHQTYHIMISRISNDWARVVAQRGIVNRTLSLRLAKNVTSSQE